MLRAIGEHDSYRRWLLTDFLASFSYVPGTVVHGGYGSIYERVSAAEGPFGLSRNLRETWRGFFFKASYLWRL